jgi:hypothetical protein
MQFNKLFLLFKRPFVSLDTPSKVIVVSLAALFTAAAHNPISIFHDFGDFTPFFYSFAFKQFL